MPEYEWQRYNMAPKLKRKKSQPFAMWVQGFGAARLAKVIGMSDRSSAQRWAAGTHKPSLKWIPTLLQLSGLKLEDIIF